MKTKKLFLGMAIISSVFIALVFSGCEKAAVEKEMRTYSFTVTRNNSALANSSVSIPTASQYYSTTTNNDGKCQINIPNDITLPPYVIVNIDNNSIKPYSLSVPGAMSANAGRTVNCENAPSSIKVRDAGLHHLGNDVYGGAANSQLQLPSEAIQISYSFNLTSIPGSMPHLQIFARGVEERPEIILNGITTDYLGDSEPNGDLSHWDFQLTADPHTVLKVGNNVLTIKTGAYSGTDPWDDIEFCGLLLYYQ